MSARAAIALVLAAAGCHYHRDVNAPGIVDPAVPPRDLADRQMEYPGDPGEHVVMLTYGGSGGAFGGSFSDDAVVDLAAEVSLAWGDNPTTHNDHESRLFLPRGVLIPWKSTGVTLGWSAVRVMPHQGADTDVTTGPIYVEAQRAWTFFGVGGGWAIDPATGGTGPQANFFYTFYYLRARVLFGDGWEVGGGLQLKLPVSWVWSR